jgi:hypothetical protein
MWCVLLCATPLLCGAVDLQLVPVKALVEDVASVSAGVDFSIWLTKGGQVSCFN